MSRQFCVPSSDFAFTALHVRPDFLPMRLPATAAFSTGKSWPHKRVPRRCDGAFGTKQALAPPSLRMQWGLSRHHHGLVVSDMGDPPTRPRWDKAPTRSEPFPQRSTTGHGHQGVAPYLQGHTTCPEDAVSTGRGRSVPGEPCCFIPPRRRTKKAGDSRDQLCGPSSGPATASTKRQVSLPSGNRSPRGRDTAAAVAMQVAAPYSEFQYWSNLAFRPARQ